MSVKSARRHRGSGSDLAVLSDEEQRELKALAQCQQLREEFDLVKRVSRRHAPACFPLAQRTKEGMLSRSGEA